jgi:hypothetical protein
MTSWHSLKASQVNVIKQAGSLLSVDWIGAAKLKESFCKKKCTHLTPWYAKTLFSYKDEHLWGSRDWGVCAHWRAHVYQWSAKVALTIRVQSTFELQRMEDRKAGHTCAHR